MGLKVLQPPNAPWMHRLRTGHFIWLPKENRYAQVAFRWQKPEPGKVAGQMFLERITGDPTTAGYVLGAVEMWYVMPDGRGFDGKPLILPLEGNFPTEVLPYDEDRIEKLENDVMELKEILLKLLDIRPRRNRMHPEAVPFPPTLIPRGLSYWDRKQGP